ncbi:MAG: AraC family transcriptional regulator [Pseudanabaenales cyanobacterium]|nr:AraC family transcriptional regulator [Pseudanabaenales cyanobacterium]
MPNHHAISLDYRDLQAMLEELQQQGMSYRSQGNEISWELHQPFGKWSSRSVHLRDELDLSMTEWDVQEDFRILVDTQMQPLFGFSFCVSGGCRVRILDSETELITHSNQAQTGFFQGDIKTITEVAAGQKVSLVQLLIDPHFLETLAAESLDHSERSLNQMFSSTQTGFQWLTREITPAMAIALHQILQCPYCGLTKRLYLESKALELIALQLAKLNERQPYLPSSTSLKPDDIDRIHVARDILICHLDNPPSLLSLAKQSGINSFKLKQGFRQVFNTTVFGYLHAYRMEEARRLLGLGDLSVTQVAQTVGYAHPGKFAAAFKKKFGITPKAMKSS